MDDLPKIGLAGLETDGNVILFPRPKALPKQLQAHATQRSAVLHDMQAKRSALRVSHPATPTHAMGMEPHEIRKKNALALRRYLGLNYAQFAQLVHASERYLWQVRTEWKRPDGKPTHMGRTVAKRIETHVGKRLPWMEPGWMERAHWDDLPPIIDEETETDFFERLKEAWPYYTDQQRQAFEVLEASLRPKRSKR